MLDTANVILIADDDPDDRLLIQEAFSESHFDGKLQFVKNGEELVDYLKRAYSPLNGSLTPRPRVILLDLNMPCKDGREALKEIKDDPVFNSIPIVVLTTSKSENDIQYSYKTGACSFIVKPSTFEQLVDAMKVFYKYWFEVAKIPKTIQ